jgi:hypothetical protein
MTSRWISGALALALVAAPGWAQAQHRGGSHGGGSHGSSGGHSGGGAVPRGSGGSHGYSTAGGRHYGGGSYHGSGYRGHYGGHYGGYRGYYYGGHYRPYYGYYGIGWGYPYAYGYWDYGYWNTPYYGGYGYDGPSYHSASAELRVMVDPSETRVYVDGYYAGVSDDFDGLFQRLDVSSGRHEIALKLEGYKTQRIKIYVSPDRTLKIHHDMVKGDGEGAMIDLRGPEAAEEEQELALNRQPQAQGRQPQAQEQREDDADSDGELRLSLAPRDASVYVDGQYFGTGREAARMDLSVGKHRIEIVRPGYRTEEREIDVRPGAPTEVAIDLQPSRL